MMNIKISIERDNSQVPVVGKLVRHLCVVADAGEHPATNKIELAIVELLNNIIGYSGVDSAAAMIDVHCQYKGADFTVTVTEGGNELSAIVANEYSNKTVSMPSLDTGIDGLPESGWGIQLIKSACDQISYRRVENSNVYTLVFDLSFETA